MHWKLKSIIQNSISRLPPYPAFCIYYWLQRNFGELKRINPINRLSGGIEIWNLIKKIGYNPIGKIFFEIGTGWIPIIPLSYWLMGAKKTITIDSNNYFKSELIKETIKYVLVNKKEVQNLFGSLLIENRFNELITYYSESNFTKNSFLDLCCIVYIAPGNASETNLESKSIDFHTSYAVLEHVRPKDISLILKEGNRIISDTGLFIHKIDYKDHFSYSDNKISPINFLQYSDEKWKRYAGNKHMYMNRLRHDDFINLFHSAGHRILESNISIDEETQSLLRTGKINLDELFINKPEEIISISESCIISRIKS